MASAAARHLRCAVSLSSAKESGEACYLVGLAAECAVKYHLNQVGFKYQVKKRARGAPSSDPIYLHFPDLATELMAQASGIVAGRILARIGDRTLLNGWSVRMRYDKQSSDKVMTKKFSTWKQQTEALFAEIGL